MHLELLVEDVSTEAMLQCLLPNLLTHSTYTIHPFLG